MNDKKTLKNAFERLIILTVLSLFAAMLLVFALNDIYAFVKPEESVTLTLSEPTTLSVLSRTLASHGVIDRPAVFYIFANLKGWKERLEGFSGEVMLSKDMSYREILLALS